MRVDLSLKYILCFIFDVLFSHSQKNWCYFHLHNNSNLKTAGIILYASIHVKRVNEVEKNLINTF